MFDQEANWDDALRRWRLRLEQVERILSGPNCSLATLHARRLIEEKQRLELQITEVESVRATRRIAETREIAPQALPKFGNSETVNRVRPTKWQNIEIRFLSDNQIQPVVSGIQEAPLNYAEIGFEDRRNGKPKQAWKILRDLAEHKGTLKQPTDGQKWRAIEKRVQEIRRLLKKHFGLSEDPLPFVEGIGYRAQFKIETAPSYHG